MPGHWFQQLQNPSHPVRYVSWYEAMAYSAWIGAQLLTEAQWERAARGTEGREYPWGTAAPDSSRANYDKQHSDPTAAGYYPLGATPEGVYDMAGNVFEWVQDVYDEYSNISSTPDPVCRERKGWVQGYFSIQVSPTESRPAFPSRVVRGGSYSDSSTSLRTFARTSFLPEDQLANVGFRCGRSCA